VEWSSEAASTYISEADNEEWIRDNI